jgi:hypothetical protein
MAEISYDSIDEVELFTTASLNNRFSAGAGSLQVPINDLETDALSPGALNENHLPSLVLARVTQAISGGATYTYAATPWSGTYAVVAQGGTDLEVNLGASYNLASGQAEGVFVMVDLIVAKIFDPASTNYDALDGCTFRIQARNGAAWRTIGRTQRFVAAAVDTGPAENVEREIYVRVPIRTLIRAADMTGGGGGTANVVDRIRVQISVVQGGATPVQVTLRECMLAAIVLQSTVV